MIPLNDAYARAGGDLPVGGQLASGTGEAIGSQFALWRSEKFNEVVGNYIAAQGDALSAAGVNVQPALRIMSALRDAKPGNIQQKIIDQYNATIADAKVANPDLAAKSTDELAQQAADDNLHAQQAASDVASRATTSQNIVGQVVGGTGAQLTDPAQLAALAALPISEASFGGNLLLRLGKSALSQAAIQGGVSLANSPQNDSFYRLQGMSDDDINAQRWRNAGQAALGGLVLTPAIEIGGMALGKALSWLTKGTLAERQAATEAFQKSNVDLGTNATADLANQSEALHYEAQNPFPPGVESNRAFASNLDNISDAIAAGDPGDYVFGNRQFDYKPPTTDTSGIALRNAELGYHLPEDVAAELGIKRPGAVSHEEINASLQKRIADGMVSSAQDESTAAAGRISDAQSHLDDLQQQHDALAIEAGKAVPNAEALRTGGLDDGTANLLADIEQQLSGKLAKKARAGLEAQREQIVQSSPGDIAAAKSGLADHVADLKSQIAETTRESSVATRAKTTADTEVARVQQISDQAGRKLDNLREAKAVDQKENVNSFPAPLDVAPPTRSALDAVRDQRAEMKRPMEPGEVSAAVKEGDDVAAGKYDDATISDARTALEEGGDLKLGEGDDRYSVTDRLNELDEHEKSLQDVLACLG